MASKEMVRRFLNESETNKHYSQTIEYALTYFIAKAEKEGDTRFAADLRKAKDTYHDEFRQAIEITEEVYADTFTDEELNELIVLHNNAAIRKLRTLGAEIINRVLEKLLAVRR
ncbi:MAG: hypothetical protein H6Q33_525 [Deltaproteobacteria bacterium]|jgi:hypothetical protein|nr:hypothetical protein [Deltaproteobacteria bacterium]